MDETSGMFAFVGTEWEPKPNFLFGQAQRRLNQGFLEAEERNIHLRTKGFKSSSHLLLGEIDLGNPILFAYRCG